VSNKDQLNVSGQKITHYSAGMRVLILCCFFVIIVFFSCKTLSPEDPVFEAPVPRFASVQEVSPSWTPVAADEVPFLYYTAGKISYPPLEFWAVCADLSHTALYIVVNDGSISTHVSGFVRGAGLLAGINATPFEPASEKEGEKRTMAGISVSNGVLISPPMPRFDALVFYTDGKAAIISQKDLAGGMEGIQNAVGGFHQILQAGQLTGRALTAKPRYARSAAGLSEDGRRLWLLVIDGKRLASIGATEEETAVLLKQLGASDGLNLDGGGSSALAVRFSGGKVKTLNTPSHHGLRGLERGVAACLGIGMYYNQ
jgi:hypothetical protein